MPLLSISSKLRKFNTIHVGHFISKLRTKQQTSLYDSLYLSATFVPLHLLCSYQLICSFGLEVLPTRGTLAL